MQMNLREFTPKLGVRILNLKEILGFINVFFSDFLDFLDFLKFLIVSNFFGFIKFNRIL